MAPPEIDGPAHLYLDGAVLRSSDAGLHEGFLAAGACYTTAVIRGGEPVWPSRHAARMARDAASQGLPAPDEATVIAALRSLGRAEFGDGRGIVRLELGLDARGEVRLVGVPRGFGDDPATWALGVAPTIHSGPEARAGAKMMGLPFIESARAWLAPTDFDEALLFDGSGHLVEGTRSNLLLVDEDGRRCFPERALGGVAGLALEVGCACFPDLVPARLRFEDVMRAEEIVAVNAVRGARPCITLEGRPVGRGVPGAFAAELACRMEQA